MENTPDRRAEHPGILWMAKLTPIPALTHFWGTPEKFGILGRGNK
jgi:hypothetical protein